MTSRFITMLLLGLLISYHSYAQVNIDNLHQHWQAISVEVPYLEENLKSIDTITVVSNELKYTYHTEDLKELKDKMRTSLILEKKRFQLEMSLFSIDLSKKEKAIFHNYPQSNTVNIIFDETKNQLKFFDNNPEQAEVFTLSKLDTNLLILIYNKDRRVITFEKFNPENDYKNAEEALEALNKMYKEERKRERNNAPQPPDEEIKTPIEEQ